MVEDIIQPNRSLAERFAICGAIFVNTSDPTLLDQPLAAFVQRQDKHLPQKLIRKTIRQLVAMDFRKLTLTPYLGEGRLLKFIDLLERVAAQLHAPPMIETVVPPLPQNIPAIDLSQGTVDLAKLPSVTWTRWCAILRDAGVESEPLGRFATSLTSISRNLWAVDVRYFTSRTLDELRSLPGYGPARLAPVLHTLGSIAQAIDAFSSSSHLRPRVVPRFIHSATCWIEEVLRGQVVPDAETLRLHFLGPLIQQLDSDLGSELTALVKRRLGVDGPAETLDAIATDCGLTRERIRQLTSKATEVFAVRWPEGRHLLDDFYELLLAGNESTEQVAIVRSVLDGLFAESKHQGISRAEVIEAWEKAGKANQTPMTHSELLRWLGENIPKLAPELAAMWISQDAPQCQRQDGDTLYFSTDPDDRFLHQLFISREPVPVYDLPDFLDGDERNIRLRLEREPRFLEDEFKRIHASELLSFFRRDRRWYITLVPSDGTDEPRTSEIPVDCLIALVVGGLTDHGIVDATVWGVHRYATTILGKAYGATLPHHITPFILANMLARHSGGHIRHMRRRRLRWDSPDANLSVRGKYDWVDYVVRQAGIPMTLDELDSSLRHRYQDYERYVLSQITSDAEEDGSRMSAAEVIPGVSIRLPAIVVPRGWSLNAAADNVSDGIKMLATRIVSATDGNRLSRQDLRRIPWMIQLCDRYAYGQMNWSDELEPPNQQGSYEAPEQPLPHNAHRQLDESTERIAAKQTRTITEEEVNAPSTEIEGLLSRFF